MRIISEARLREYWQGSRKDEPSLRYWRKITKSAEWDKPNDIKKTFSKTSIYKGKTRLVYIFDVGGNKVRVICSINFTTKIVYILFVLSHNEYSKDRWKEPL